MQSSRPTKTRQLSAEALAQKTKSRTRRNSNADITRTGWNLSSLGSFNSVDESNDTFNGKVSSGNKMQQETVKGGGTGPFLRGKCWMDDLTKKGTDLPCFVPVKEETRCSHPRSLREWV